ncbi:MAG: hypothetical protein K6G51_07970 [Sphaerochaetaceae bacterium]|nr:hypothetical protein [Sphaerochaetaceae bacterium]
MKIEPRPICSCGRVHPVGESCDVKANAALENLDSMKKAYEKAVSEYGMDSGITASLGMNIALTENDPEKIDKAAREVLRTMEKNNILYLQAYFILLQSLTDRRLKREAFTLLDEIFVYIESEDSNAFVKEKTMNLAGAAGMFLKAFGEKDTIKYIDKAIKFIKDSGYTESEGYALLLTAKSQLLENDPLMKVDCLPLMEEAFNILKRVDGLDANLTMQVLEDIMDLHIRIKSEDSYVEKFIAEILDSIEDKESVTYISYELTPGAYYINRGMEDKAIEIAQKNIDKTENIKHLHLQAIYLKALAEQNKNNYRAALRSFTKLKEETVGFYRDGSDQLGTVLSGIAYNAEKVGRYELAATILEELIARNAPAPSLGSRLDVLMKLRELYLLSGHPDLAGEIDRALNTLEV